MVLLILKLILKKLKVDISNLAISGYARDNNAIVCFDNNFVCGTSSPFSHDSCSVRVRYIPVGTVYTKNTGCLPVLNMAAFDPSKVTIHDESYGESDEGDYDSYTIHILKHDFEFPSFSLRAM